MFLVGRFDLKLDAKNRLSIPLAFRNKMNVQTEGVGFYVMPGRRKGTLALYPELYFEQIRSQDPLPSESSDDAFAFYQFHYANCFSVTPDEQSRVLLPKKVLDLAEIGAPCDVVLTGMRDHLVLWRSDDFEAFEQQTRADYPALEAKALSERQARGSAAPQAASRAC
jgi:division/cell wall cluster transcriptional repressor MraZ